MMNGSGLRDDQHDHQGNHSVIKHNEEFRISDFGSVLV